MQNCATASRVHDQLLAALDDLARAEHRAVVLFADVMRRHLYRDLEYGSIHDYAMRALGFSRSKAAQFVRLARALKEHPALSKEMASGELRWTNAREILPVLDKKNDRTWIDRAKTTSRRQLVEDVKRARQRPRSDPQQPSLAPVPAPAPPTSSAPLAPPQLPSGPVTVSFTLDAEQYARYEALVEAVRKAGIRGDRAELLLAALDALRKPAGSSAETKETDRVSASPASAAAPSRVESPYRIVTYMCRTCGRAHTPTNRGDRAVSVVELARQMSDGEFVEEGKRRRRTISPATRARVTARDGHRCQTDGCGSSRFLEVHHLKPLAKGGTNDDDNLITLCARCHRAAHEREAGAAATSEPNTATDATPNGTCDGTRSMGGMVGAETSSAKPDAPEERSP